MKKILHIIIYIPLLLLTACDVHEWPDLPEKVKINLKLNYETEFTEWEHKYEDNKTQEIGTGNSYDNHLAEGKIRYIIRAFPFNRKNRTATRSHNHEFIFYRDIAEGYNCEFLLDILPGDYVIKVWSDLTESESQEPYYDASDFIGIVVNGKHKGNCDHRDAFRGSTDVSLVAQYIEQEPQPVNITMQRPLAKFELITTDLKKFIDEELAYLAKIAATRGDEAPTRVNIDKYKVKFVLHNMANEYYLDADKPVDTDKNSVVFESKLNIINDDEASLGFDYIFVNGQDSKTEVQVALYDDKGREIASTEIIRVPIRRSHHTKLKGTFLTQKTSGGIRIESEFSGNHNYIYGDEVTDYEKIENEK